MQVDTKARHSLPLQVAADGTLRVVDACGEGDGFSRKAEHIATQGNSDLRLPPLTAPERDDLAKVDLPGHLF